MASFRSVIGIGLASAMMISAPVFAATPQHSPAPATAAKPVLRAPAKQAAATPATTPARTKVAWPAHKATKRPAHFATVTLKSGKKVTYNCSLAGNKMKEACKG